MKSIGGRSIFITNGKSYLPAISHPRIIPCTAAGRHIAKLTHFGNSLSTKMQCGFDPLAWRPARKCLCVLAVRRRHNIFLIRSVGYFYMSPDEVNRKDKATPIDGGI